MTEVDAQRIKAVAEDTRYAVAGGSTIALSPTDAWVLFIGSEKVCGDDRAN